MVRTVVDTHLRVRRSELPEGAGWMIKDFLTIPNEDRLRARRERVRGWEDMPEHINLWAEVQSIDMLVMPRGFAQKYKEIIELLDNTVDWVDERHIVYRDNIKLFPVDLREHQVEPVEKALEYEQGIYEAPPGAGKTVTMLEVIRRSRQRSLILVDKTNIAEQWRERAKTFIGADIGLIGDSVWEEKDITVALQQTLWSRRRELQHADWFDNWGLVVLDECHHAAASTYNQLFQKFPSYYRFGVSATPDRHEWNFPIVVNTIGPIFSTTSRKPLQEKKVLVKPKVEIITTDFNFGFRSTSVNSNGYRKSNNYQLMMDRLTINEERNDLIVRQILSQQKAAHMVLSRRLNHLQGLASLCEEQGFDSERLFLLIGEVSRSDRMLISTEAEKGSCVIFSTIADEALDIPRLDRIHLVWPTRNPKVVRQQVGRIERFHPDKTDAIVYDYYDAKIGVLRNQFAERLNGVYKAEDMDIERL